MNKPHFRRICQGDLKRVLSLELRDADKAEVKASGGFTTKEALFYSLQQTRAKHTYVVEDGEGKIIGAFGLATLSSQKLCAFPWFLASDEIQKYKKTFTREARKIIERWLEEYFELRNFVSVENVLSTKWLKSLGFTFGEPSTLHDGKTLFYPFVKTRGNDV
nr:hypothetical protein 8 [Deltaproteobacteria bacterium]